jgi:hypothetical protein
MDNNAAAFRMMYLAESKELFGVLHGRGGAS